MRAFLICLLGGVSLCADTTPRLDTIEPPGIDELSRSTRAGIQFLIETQNANGSWGNPTKTKGLNIYAPVPGSHHAFRAAVTSIAIMGLCRNAELYPEAHLAIDKAADWLLRELPDLRRADPTTTYNVWGHAYGIRALVALAELHADQSSKVADYRALAENQTDFLLATQEINGGWGYLDFDLSTQIPSGNPTSFTTATVLIALHEAKEHFDITLDDPALPKAVAQILRQRTPDGAFVYAEGHRWHPRLHINRPMGSLARSQVCHVALAYFDQHEFSTQALIDAWLDRMWARIGWLDIARKRPIPHESWAANSGYFFYYGAHYAAMAIDLLEEPDRQTHHAAHLAHILVNLQERNGSWWDYPLYDYHQAYGTGYALCALARIRRILD